MQLIINIIKGESAMPGRNGTGPLGMGPMTGWGRGWCAAGTGYPAYGFGRFGMAGGFYGPRGVAYPFAFGRGRRFGGFGRRWRF